MENIKAAALQEIDVKKDICTGVSDTIWDHPELSLKEFYATEVYCKVLREQGFEVTEKLGGIETAFSGSFGSGKPVIGILAEYDALSGLSQKENATEKQPLPGDGVGHGCGHNLLGGGALAAALAVKKYLELSGKPGTVVFYGCPGEEGGAGKAFLAREGMWKVLDAALTWHPESNNEVSTGTCNSCIQVLYKFKGISAHAAGNPHMGRSALDAVELMNIGVQFLREHATPDCRIHYAITDAGGISPNVVQSEASVLYMTRANKVADTVALQKRVDNIAKGAAMMTDTTFERVFIDGTAETLPNYALEKLMYDNFAEIGVPTYTQEEMDFAAKVMATYPAPSKLPGYAAEHNMQAAKLVREKTENLTKPLNDFLLPYYSGEDFGAGSTDVGDVSWLTPTVQAHVACWPAGVPGHSWQVVTFGKSSVAHKGLLTAGKVIAATAIDLYEDPDLLKKIQEEFKERSIEGYTCPIEPDAVPIAL